MANAEELTCEELTELITEYIEGTLSTDDHVRFEEHLAVCEGCANYLDQMRKTIALTGRLRVDDLAPEVRTELLARFRGWGVDSPG